VAVGTEAVEPLATIQVSDPMPHHEHAISVCLVSTFEVRRVPALDKAKSQPYELWLKRWRIA
jgi:hypothetical protein